MSGVNNTPMTGPEWATHAVSLLLCNTYSLYGTALALARQDATGAALGKWVSEWFWGGSLLFELPGSDRGAVIGTRDGVAKNDFREIDWKSVAEDLGGEE